MSSSAISTQVAQLKIGSVQNQADSSSVYSNGVWSFKNSTALTSVTITDAGNVGIGTASPATTSGKALHIFNDANTGTVASNSYLLIQSQNRNAALELTGSASGLNSISFSSTVGTSVASMVGDVANQAIYFRTGGITERMRIDASGNLLVNQTSAINNLHPVQIRAKGVNGEAISLVGLPGLTSCGRLDFNRGDNGASAFSISANSTTFYIADDNFSNFATLSQNFTSWTFGSDRRIKENIEDCKYGLAEVLAIQPRKYKFISTGEEDIGFIAQELRRVIPEAVSGVEQEFSEEDTPQERANKTLGVSKDTLIPVLVKAIQELSAKNDALEARLAALEAKP